MWLFAHITDTTDEILGFLLTLFESLKVQLGPALTEQTVQQLLHTFTRQQLTETLHHESTAGSRVITKFLKILQLLVQEPAASFKAFLPNIIGLCMEQLYPILIEVKNHFLLYSNCKLLIQTKKNELSVLFVLNSDWLTINQEESETFRVSTLSISRK